MTTPTNDAKGPTPSNRFGALAPALALLLMANIGVQLFTLADRATSTALAQSRSGGEPPTVFPNATETQRKIEVQVIEVNQRLGRIEAKLDKPLSVKVLEMPPVTILGRPESKEESK